MHCNYLSLIISVQPALTHRMMEGSMLVPGSWGLRGRALRWVCPDGTLDITTAIISEGSGVSPARCTLGQCSIWPTLGRVMATQCFWKNLYLPFWGGFHNARVTQNRTSDVTVYYLNHGGEEGGICKIYHSILCMELVCRHGILLGVHSIKHSHSCPAREELDSFTINILLEWLVSL